jgi:hypothetical protein
MLRRLEDIENRSIQTPVDEIKLETERDKEILRKINIFLKSLPNKKLIINSLIRGQNRINICHTGQLDQHDKNIIMNFVERFYDVDNYTFIEEPFRSISDKLMYYIQCINLRIRIH